MFGAIAGNYHHDRTHYLGEDGYTESISIQGKVLKWKVCKRKSLVPPEKKRGEVNGFSDESRWRLLKLIGAIDWRNAGDSLFITLTYHDSLWPITRPKLNVPRAVFWRDLEEYLGHHVPCIWRVEWEPRKSGKLKKYLMPHYHIITFREYFIDKKFIADRWKSALGLKCNIRTKVQRCTNDDMAAAYIAKYCAKVSSNVLVNTAYHNIPTGRHWGRLRKELIPMEEETRLRVIANDWTEETRLEAWKTLKNLNVIEGGSFTLLGREAVIIGLKLKQMLLDGRIVVK